jgi:hypothetical protein
LLNYNEKAIAEAGAHEAGHTFGLKHQAVYNGTVLVNQYNYGAGSGEIGWAPIMGCAYYQNVSTWHNGPNSVSSTTFQNDVAIIASLVGYPADDYVNTTSGAAVLSTSLNGKLNSSTDIDFFSVNIASANTLTVIPKNVAPGNVGANTDLVIKIYNSSGSLINTVNDASILNASIPLNAGQYFISVAAAPNAYATSTYGMLGQYNISLN